jgi:glycosyltransferase involved in cell wall biosynthesis
MKVLQILGGGSWGGGSVVVMAYLEQMIERGDEVWVLCLEDDVERRFHQAGCRTVRSPFWFHPINPCDVIPFFQLWRLCRREKFDLVATHTSKGGFLGRLAARAAGVRRIVHHAHGFAFRETQPQLIQRCYAVLERIASRACDLIISVSEDHRQLGIRERVAAPEKIVTVLNGIDVDAFSQVSKDQARAGLGFGPADLLIGVASRLAPKKGIGDLIAAFPAIHRTHPTAQLVLIGDGPARADLEAQARATGLAGRIHFPGFRQDVERVLAAFDLLLQPSISEGLSISVLEAMAAGKPLIVCDIPGNREIITSEVNGLMAAPSDPAALSDAVLWMLDHPAQAAAMGSTALADCRRRFSRDRMVAQILETYDGLFPQASCRGSAANPPLELVRKG